jgi:hypothetical protein
MIAARPDATRPNAYVVACFGDPGLDGMRNLIDVPVLGIAQVGARRVLYTGSADHELGCPVSDHDDGRVRAAAGDRRHDRPVDHPQSIDTADSAPRIQG